MRCDRCVLEPVEGADPKLPLFFERLSTCDDCPLLTAEQATPLVHMLVRLHRTAARAMRGLENDVRKLKGALREAEASADQYEERIALIERRQQVSTHETEEELRAQIAIIQQQRVELNALAAPIIRVQRGVLVLPIIGSLDRERTESIAKRLLLEVASTGTAYVIIDLTGLEAVDAETADHLYKVIRALKLLGSRTMLSGIRGALAQAFVRFNIETSSLATLRTLEDALRSILSVEASSSAPLPLEHARRKPPPL